MRLLKYAILGLINRAPVTGYDIGKEFDRGLVNFWYATHSQIYPELRRLTEEGLITFEIAMKGSKLAKKRYMITEKGKQDLKKWLSTCDKLEPTPKDLFRLKLYYANQMDREKIKNHLEKQLQQRTIKLNYLESCMIKHQNTKADYGKKFDADLGDYLVLNGAIMREKNYLEWLRFCMEYLETIK
jgi:DNA-binding PadR family transcriptional regulator